MPFPSALTTDNYTALRGTSYNALSFAAFLPNTVIFQAQVNGAPSGTSYAQVTFDNVTTGIYTDVLEGLTVLIGTGSMRDAAFVGRVRKVPTSSILYINETSADIADNSTIWVIQDRRVWDRLARINIFEFKDYDIAWELPPSVVTGLQSFYAGIVSGSPLGYTVSFAPTGLPLASGATISSWLWHVPSGMTITVGSSTTQNITARFDSGFNDYVGLKVTDSNGKHSDFYFWVVAVAKDFSNVVTLQAVNPSLNAGENGWSGSIDAFDEVTTLLDNNAIMIFDVERYNGTAGSIFSNVKFGGRIRLEADNSRGDYEHGLLRKVTFTLEGIAEQLSRIEHLPFTLVNDSTPSAWDEIKDLSVIRAVYYTLWWHSTFLTLYSLTSDYTSLASDPYKYPLLPTQGGNILSIIQDLIVSINGAFQSCATGESQVVRNALYLSLTQRSLLTVVANFTEADGIDYSLTHTEVDSSGKVQASGGYFTTNNNKVVALLSLAPGMAQSIGENIVNFARQILTANSTQAAAQSELNTRSGNHFAVVAREQDVLNVTMRGGYNWIQPSVNQWYTWTLPADFTRGARAYTTADRWQCISANVGYDAAGTHTVQASFKLESIGVPGDTVVLPAPQQIPQNLPVIPPTPPFMSLPPTPSYTLPPDPTDADTPPYTPPVIVSNGNICAFISDGDASQVFLTQKLLLSSTPPCVDITPTADLIYTDFQWIGAGFKGAYLLSNNGTDTHFFYTEDAFSASPVWLDTVLTNAIYTDIRVASTPGSVVIGGVTLAGSSAPAALWSVKIGTEIARTADTLTVQSTFDGSQYNAVIWTNNNPDICSQIGALDVVFTVGAATGSQTIDCGGSFPADLNGAFIGGCLNYLAYKNTTPATFTIQVTFHNDISCGDPTVPTYNVATSTDFGASFAAPQVLAPSLSDNVGFDIERVGNPVLAGTPGQVQIATTLGGTFAAYGSAVPTDGAPNAIVCPRFQFGSSTGNISTSTPQYLLASGAIDASDHTAWKVTASGATFTNVTPTIAGVHGTVAGPNALAISYRNSNRWSIIADFAGTPNERHLLTNIAGTTSWTDRGQIADDAACVTYRILDPSMRQIYIANGADGILVSQNHGSTLQAKTPPTTDPIVIIRPY
jgi:hypothetical protein